MCGFAGFTNPFSEMHGKNILDKMLAPIKHRGPDSNSVYVNKKIALGHYRLSIIDLKGGNQPRIDKEENHYLLYNGEIYGYKKHASMLRKHGIELRDNSDTEVLFQSLKHFGVEKTLQYIDGMYSFIFYESINDTLWLVRDPMGEKPLYYSITENNTFFSSELSSLASCSNILPYNIDENAIISYLNFDYIPKDKTILSEIHKNTYQISDSKEIENEKASGNRFEKEIDLSIAQKEIDTLKNEKKEEINSNSKTFNEWLTGSSIDSNVEHLTPKKVIYLEFDKPKKEFYSASKKAKESLLENNLPISETLAKIHAAQGNIEKAIQIYKQLQLLFPEKKTFFARQIKNLRSK